MHERGTIPAQEGPVPHLTLRLMLRLTSFFVLASIAGCTCAQPAAPADAGDMDSGELDGGASAFSGDLRISPDGTVLEVRGGQPLPSVQLDATADGAPVTPTWATTPAALGTVDAMGLFTATGAGVGIATVTATYGSATDTTTVTIRARLAQNGGTDGGTVGAGGFGGVGGEGEGGPVTPALDAVLSSSPTSLAGLALLYPYDGTVWPRGLLPPLLQWSAGGQSFEAVAIELACSAVSWRGTFAKTATPFVHHPVPRGAWREVTEGCAGQTVSLKVTLATQTQAYGPLTASWRVAPGLLKGVVYYNSYGTKLALNHGGALPNNGLFGGATLAIKGSSTDPVLVAGGSGGDSQCRVCHVVSADGSTLISQHGENYQATSQYALRSGNAETSMAPGDGRFAWGGLSPDGKLLFSHATKALAGGSDLPSGLYQVPSGAPVAATGLPAGLRAATPVFSPDGKSVAFNFYGGSAGGSVGDRRTLAMMRFTAPETFSDFAGLVTPSAGQSAVYPSFLPSGAGVVYELETESNGRGFAETRSKCDTTSSCSGVGARGELWWVDVATKRATRLDRLNGSGGALPVGANGHGDDSTLNYEPTVSPIPSGGYAWVIFTSRRMYGNVATINPYYSDPRYHDISTSPTPKKLWVAAIDLNPAPGTDPSHPAFYLPAQELLAGNSRGYWALEPCLQDGASCASADQCCGGFCRGESDSTAVCGATAPGCSREFERCTKNEDCCDTQAGAYCENNRCVVAQIE